MRNPDKMAALAGAIKDTLDQIKHPVVKAEWRAFMRTKFQELRQSSGMKLRMPTKSEMPWIQAKTGHFHPSLPVFVLEMDGTTWMVTPMGADTIKELRDLHG